VPIAGEPAPSLADVPAAAPPLQVASAGPRLRVSVGADGLVASVDGSPDEPTTIDELRQAAPALAAADGTAVVDVSTDDPTARQTAGTVLDVLRRAGVMSRLA
jgi:biopolymer transport protein ExbD